MMEVFFFYQNKLSFEAATTNEQLIQINLQENLLCPNATSFEDCVEPFEPGKSCS